PSAVRKKAPTLYVLRTLSRRILTGIRRICSYTDPASVARKGIRSLIVQYKAKSSSKNGIPSYGKDSGQQVLPAEQWVMVLIDEKCLPVPVSSGPLQNHGVEMEAAFRQHRCQPPHWQ